MLLEIMYSMSFSLYREQYLENVPQPARTYPHNSYNLVTEAKMEYQGTRRIKGLIDIFMGHYSHGCG